MKFTFYRQLNAMDCGPACLRMIAKYYGRHYNTETISRNAGFGKEGVSLLGVSEAAEKLGFRARGVQPSVEQLANDVTLPCILHWDHYHFVVLIKIRKPLFGKEETYLIADPSMGVITYSRKEFTRYWAVAQTETNEVLGFALLLEPMPKFYEEEGDKEKKLSWGFLFQYLKQSRWQITQVFIALVIASLLQLIFPFLTQSIVDSGISTRNLQYIVVILIAQLMLLFSRTIVDFIRSRLLLYISTTVNLSILSDFWIKLTRLPISYFDVHHTGDTIQRLDDNKQIQLFLTGSALNTLFSLFNLIIYGFVLAGYNTLLFVVFASGSVLYFIWIKLFLKVRRKINYQTFRSSANENNVTLQLVQGMQEIRLNNAEQLKRWEWENIQAGIFKLNFKTLNFNQIQQAGSLFINQGKDILITFLVAGLVIDGKLTLGAMLAVQYIIGQLNSPIEQFAGFVQSAQDAKMSMERLNDIHQFKDEESHEDSFLHHLPENKSIRFTNVSFTYPGAGNEPVLKNIDLEIPEGKITAIVGSSGSGKTTILKLLLKYYDFYGGDIKVGDMNFKNISPSFWRRQCGAVMQDGFIFNDSIARNINVGEQDTDEMKLIKSCKTANILSYAESQPKGFYTHLGADGTGISQGQKQRLLIARAIYKEPKYLFFDEATNALDSNNERTIVQNLEAIFKNKTVVIVAHRLSTVKNADKIIVLDKGCIVEEGTHHYLSRQRGRYYDLVKNQLELSE